MAAPKSRVVVMSIVRTGTRQAQIASPIPYARTHKPLPVPRITTPSAMLEHLENFTFADSQPDFFRTRKTTSVEEFCTDAGRAARLVNEYWTSGQRQAHSLHEVSYRACFKPQLPCFFIARLTDPGDIVYDPFGGRGTVATESALPGRQVKTNSSGRPSAGPRTSIDNASRW